MIGTDTLVPAVDLIVIGTGPAGMSACLTATQMGLSVVMIGQENSHPYMIIESVHEGIVSLLRYLHADDCLDAAVVANYTGIRTGRSIVGLGHDENSQPYLGLHLNRRVFDKKMLLRCMNNGALVNSNSKVVSLIKDEDAIIGAVTSDRKTIYAKYVIDASGKQKFAGKKLGYELKFFSGPLLSWAAVSCTHNGGKVPTPAEVSQFIPEKCGWSWIAPIPNGFIAWTRVSKKGKIDFEPPEELKGFSIATPIRKANVRWSLFRPLCQQGIILCGDAAGVIDPAAGQGVLQALYSGMKAARTVGACMQNPQQELHFLATYDKWFVEQFEHKAGLLTQHYDNHDIDF